MAGLWNKRFPHLIPENIVLPERLEGDTLHLEDHELVVFDVGHSDTDESTCLYVPSIDLVVAVDLAYNGVHQYFAESMTRQKRMEWIAALGKIEALNPSVVIAGHKRDTLTAVRKRTSPELWVGQRATLLQNLGSFGSRIKSVIPAVETFSSAPEVERQFRLLAYRR